jgi:Skp family chaperone for outer membrane proteins
MTRKILELYNTFLARFGFFRKHIELLLALSEELDMLKAKIEDLDQHKKELIRDIRKLEDKTYELSAVHDKPPKEKETSRDLMRTSQDIMQSIYTNYFATGETVPDQE